ncbi:MAG: hypothetical protein K6T16_00805 [Candidatus Pacearchaeota archaeon]|nr:hypothetical protein [Candidatus Pacearchaeota archaeon]
MSKKDVKEKIAKGWLHAHLIFEVLGKPAEHVEKAIELLVSKLGEEKNLEIIGKNIHKPRAVEKTEKVFTCFAEVELVVQSFSRLIELIFDYMPASIEITEPTSLNFKVEDANALINDLATRLHQYDLLSKRLKIERDILLKKLSEEMGKQKGKEETGK